MKAEMLLKQKNLTKVVETLEEAIQLTEENIQEIADSELLYLVQAHCFLGETLFISGDYKTAERYFSYIIENSAEIQEKWDDLLDNEIKTADLLMTLIIRYT